MSSSPVVSHADALRRLQEGNARFASGVRSIESLGSSRQRDALVAGQSPFAAILSCADSRAPAELVFDCGLGDLFVVRVAGNIVAPSLLGSLEFAVATFHTELIVVMGHTRCGAIAATVDSLRSGKRAPSENIHDIVDRIAPGVTELAQSDASRDHVVHAATRANIRVSADHLRHGSRILEDRVREGRLRIVGCEYQLETGTVDFFDM